MRTALVKPAAENRKCVFASVRQCTHTFFKGFCVVGARLNDFPIRSHHVHWTANPTTKCSIFKHARLGPVWRVLVLYSGPWFYCWCWNWALPLSFVTCLECLRMVWVAWQKWKARAKRAIKWEKGHQEVIVKLWCWESWAIGVSKFTATVASRNWICLYYNSMLWEFWLLKQMQQVRHWNNVTNATNETPTRHCLSATCPFACLLTSRLVVRSGSTKLYPGH